MKALGLVVSGELKTSREESLRTPWQNGPHKAKTNRRHKKHSAEDCLFVYCDSTPLYHCRSYLGGQLTNSLPKYLREKWFKWNRLFPLTRPTLFVVPTLNLFCVFVEDFSANMLYSVRERHVQRSKLLILS